MSVSAPRVAAARPAARAARAAPRRAARVQAHASTYKVRRGERAY